MPSIKRHTLLLLDGEEVPEQVLRPLHEQADFIIATDGAARLAKTHGLRLDVIIGDLDSLDDETRAYFPSADIIGIADQYSNDFEKALRYLIDKRLTDSLAIVGLHGKRTDHELTNLSVLVRFRDNFDRLVSFDSYHEHYLLTGAHPSLVIDAPIDSLISLTPLPTAFGVTTEGLHYPINNERMDFGVREGLSNIINVTSGAHVSLTGGALLLSTPYDSVR